MRVAPILRGSVLTESSLFFVVDVFTNVSFISTKPTLCGMARVVSPATVG
jgi:hypothetical protein